ncbi:MAG TPA: tryptophan-rich sensory protein [Kiritimatiellia bacterium]|nr:tryptophan-rich sensory protein [Kiritimatiellia bacterium]
MTTSSEANTVENTAKRRSLLSMLAWFALCFGAGALGSLFTASAVPTWYAGLVKPAWNPPAWVFGPVWTLLYLMMAVAAWMIWRQAPSTSRSQALRWFMLQLLLNAMWSPAFFGCHSPVAGLVIIMVLWLAIVMTVVLFWKASRVAGVLLLPYLAWVSFATALNFAVWKLN